MNLFKKAIEGNEHILVYGLDVDSGFWTALQKPRILNEQQFANCQSKVS